MMVDSLVVNQAVTVESLPAGECVGLIAGEGRLPYLVAEGVRASGRRIGAIALAGQADDSLAQHCDLYRVVGLVSIGRWIRTFRRWGVREAVMVGRVAHTRKYARFQFLRHPPDWRAARLWYRVLRHDRRTATLLTTLADELAKNGVTLIDTRTYIPDHLATIGPMGATSPNADLQRDIDFGWPLFEETLELGLGQAIAVCGRDIVAVEAAEGTDAMIRRAGQLCRGRPWTLLKASSRNHDMRADVATVGVETVEGLAATGGRCLALGAGRVIIVDRPQVIAAADRLGIALVGIP